MLQCWACNELNDKVVIAQVQIDGQVLCFNHMRIWLRYTKAMSGEIQSASTFAGAFLFWVRHNVKEYMPHD